MNKDEKLKLYSKLIYKRIEELAMQNDLIVGRWAISADLTPATVYGLKNSDKIPNIITIKYLCDAIDITLSQFFDIDYLNNIKF